MLSGNTQRDVAAWTVGVRGGAYGTRRARLALVVGLAAVVIVAARRMGGQVVSLDEERMVRRGREPWCTKQELADHLGFSVR